MEKLFREADNHEDSILLDFIIILQHSIASIFFLKVDNFCILAYNQLQNSMKKIKG